MWSICKKEFAHYFGGLTGYLIISFYLTVNGLFLFVLPSFNLFDFGYTSLQVYFEYAPWFLLLLIPAITMRIFSDEYQLGSFELLNSLPISSFKLVVGKFLGALLIVIMAIAPTFLYAIALDQLSATGGIDWGATMGSYIGLFFLAAVYTAIGIFSSSLTKQSMIALLIAIILSIVVFKGFDLLSTLSFFQNGYDFYVKQIGLSHHYFNMSRGVLTFVDLIYFVTIACLFVMGCMEQVQKRKSPIYILLVMVALNFGASWTSFQLDLTKDKRFTLNEHTKDIVSSIDQPIMVHLYLGGDLSPTYKKLSLATQNMLNKLASISPKQLRWTLEVPNEMYKDSALYSFYDSLASLGLPIERVKTNETAADKRVDQLLVPGVLIETEGKAPIAIDLRSSKQYFKPYNIVKDIAEVDIEATMNAAEALLEFKLAQAIYLLNRTKVPTISYLIGNGEPVDLSVNDLGQSIRHQYNLSVFDLTKGYPDAAKIKTLLVVKPSKPFSELDKLKIDQYILSGGNVIWAIDKLYSGYDSLEKSSGEYVAYDRGLNLEDIFFTYGVRIRPNLAQDLNCAKLPVVVGTNPDGSPVIQRVPFPYFPFLKGNPQVSMVQNLDLVLSQFPSTIDTIKVAGVNKQILLSTDTNSRVIASPAMVSLMSGKTPGELETFIQHQLPIAVLLEGNFKSIYANRISQALNDSLVVNTQKPFIAKSKLPGKQIVIADADVFTNGIDKVKGPLPMGMLPLEEYRFANREFFTNAISYLNEPIDLLESRNKQVILRLLDKEKLAANKWVWQLLLLFAPLFLLGLFGFIWEKHRRSQFAS